jgi:hypothetical protein
MELLREKKEKKKGTSWFFYPNMQCPSVTFLLCPLEHKSGSSLVPIFIGGKATKNVEESIAIDAIDPLDPHECDNDKLI